VVAGLGLALRVGYVLLVAVDLQLVPDSVWYQLQAGTIADGQGYVDPRTFYSFQGTVATAAYPPLWPTLLAVPAWLGVGTTRNYELTGALVGVVTVVLVGVLGRRVAGPRVGLAAAAIAALSPFLVAADGSLMSESLYTCLVTGILLAAYAVIRVPSAWRWLVLGALGGLATLTRGDGLVIAAVLLVTVAWRTRGTKGISGSLGAGVAVRAMAVVVAPWVARNAARVDGVVISTNVGGMVEGANCARTYSGTQIGFWTPDCMREYRRPGRAESASSRASLDAGIRYARAHPVRAVAVVPVRVLRGWGMWNPVSQTRAEEFESRSFGWQLVGWGFSFATIVLSGFGLVRLRRGGAEVAPLVALLGAVTIILAVSYGDQRFRVCAEPVLAVLAGAVVAEWARPRLRHEG
jgi:4-amino-4-deoxy-L-arabinose transferase-like glycosyltransferase